MSDGLDTALARLLDREGAISRALLVELLAEVRSAREEERDVELGCLLVARGHLDARPVEDALARLDPPLTRAEEETWAESSDEQETWKDDEPQPEPKQRRYGPYEVVRRLGKGGMAIVYEVVHVLTRERYALKRLLVGSEPDERLRFVREARLLASLDHPGLVQVHAAELESSEPYLVLRLCSGGSLQQRLIQEGPLSLEEVEELLVALADALDHLHEQGVLHRDIKPHNVLYDDEGRPRLADFGLARTRGGMTLTATGELLGTPAYMAPEQIEDPRGVDERADVYALGAVLYAALCGRPPHLGESPLGTLQAVLTERTRSPRERRPDTPRAWARACMQALERDPALRPQNAGALVDAMGERWTPRLPRRALALALGALALCSLVWSATREPSPRPSPAPPRSETPPSLERPWRAEVAALASSAPVRALELALDHVEEWRGPDRDLAGAVAATVPLDQELLARLSKRPRSPDHELLLFQLTARLGDVGRHPLRAPQARALQGIEQGRLSVEAKLERSIAIVHGGPFPEAFTLLELCEDVARGALTNSHRWGLARAQSTLALACGVMVGANRYRLTAHFKDPKVARDFARRVCALPGDARSLLAARLIEAHSDPRRVENQPSTWRPILRQGRALSERGELPAPFLLVSAYLSLHLYDPDPRPALRNVEADIERSRSVPWLITVQPRIRTIAGLRCLELAWNEASASQPHPAHLAQARRILGAKYLNAFHPHGFALALCDLLERNRAEFYELVNTIESVSSDRGRAMACSLLRAMGAQRWGDPDDWSATLPPPAPPHVYWREYYAVRALGLRLLQRDTKSVRRAFELYRTSASPSMGVPWLRDPEGVRKMLEGREWPR